MNSHNHRWFALFPLMLGAGGCDDGETDASRGTPSSSTGGDSGSGGGAGAAEPGGGGQGGVGQGGEGGTPECSGPTDCDDLDECTVDSCNGGSCEHLAEDCDDGAFCNGAETCDVVLGCQAGTQVDPDDGVACTDDSCDELNDALVNAANDANCDDGVACTNDTCDAANGCELTADDTFCDDGVACTNDACDLVNDCEFVADDNICNDADSCTVDTCDSVNGCGYTPVAGTPACDDGDGCTLGDTCQTGVCTSNSVKTCSGGASCIAGTCNAPECLTTFQLGPQQDIQSGIYSWPESADLDLDGDLDLAVAMPDFPDNGVRVFLNQGTGTYSPGVKYQTQVQGSPQFVAVGRLDADALPDLVTADSTSSVSKLFNQGAGTFGGLAVVSTSNLSAANPSSVAIADLDGDGVNDLAVPNFGADTIALISSISGFTSLKTCSGPRSVGAADLDSDADVDLVIGCVNSSVVRVMLNAGDGAFPMMLDHSVVGGPSRLLLTDLDGNGAPDVAFGAGSSAGVLLNQGNGQLSAATYFPLGAGVTGIATADFDADGANDLVFASSNSVRAVLNQGNGTFGAAVSFPAIAPGCGGECGPNAVGTTDADADGRADVVVTFFTAVSILHGACVP